MPTSADHRNELVIGVRHTGSQARPWSMDITGQPDRSGTGVGQDHGTGPGNVGDDASLIDIITSFERAGYRGQMAARPEGRIICFTCHQESDAATVAMEELRRTEGASDPDDMVAIVALLCPHCGTRGTLLLNFGPEATAEDVAVLSRLVDRRAGHFRAGQFRSGPVSDP